MWAGPVRGTAKELGTCKRWNGMMEHGMEWKLFLHTFDTFQNQLGYISWEIRCCGITVTEWKRHEMGLLLFTL